MFEGVLERVRVTFEAKYGVGSCSLKRFWPNMVAEVVFGGVLEKPKMVAEVVVWTGFGQIWAVLAHLI